MKGLIRRRWCRTAAVLLLAGLGVVFACAWHFRIWSFQDLRLYLLMSRECHPVWRDLHWGHILHGQDVEEVITRTRPLGVQRFEEFVVLGYQEPGSFAAVSVVARDGKLVAGGAWSCTWRREFFNSLTTEEWELFNSAHLEFMKRQAKSAAAK